MSLIQQNLIPGKGDALITFDTETGLEWLSLNATMNLSYLDVLGGAGGYTTTYGFRYATGSEIGTLMTHAGITRYGISHTVPFPIANHLAMETLIDLMGGIAFTPNIAGGSVFIQTQGMMKFRGPGIPTPTMPTSVVQLWCFKHNPNSSYSDSNPAGRAGIQVPEIGSYLVRTRVVSSVTRTRGGSARGGKAGRTTRSK